MQFNKNRAFLCITAIMASAATGRAAQIGSVEQGPAIARERCAECHLTVKENGRSTMRRRQLSQGLPTLQE